jgi:cytochrome c-L
LLSHRVPQARCRIKPFGFSGMTTFCRRGSRLRLSAIFAYGLTAFVSRENVRFRLLPFRLGLLAASFVVASVDALPSVAVEFRHALDNSPLDVSPLPGEKFTEAVMSFQKTGVNSYRGDAAAIARGKELYTENCQVCHLPDGSGGMGASLIAETPLYQRDATDVGMFEIIHSGASGAMRSFSKRGMTQDDMLAIIAYVRTLKK